MINHLFERISEFIYTERESIPITDSVIVTDVIWGRLDIVVNRYWRGIIHEAGWGEYVDVFPWVQLLYDFNNISNPFDVLIGQVIDIPDISTLLASISLYNFEIPGIKQSTEPTIVENDSLTNLNIVSTNNISTTAIPKLRVNQRQVKYDKETGKVLF